MTTRAMRRAQRARVIAKRLRSVRDLHIQAVTRSGAQVVERRPIPGKAAKRHPLDCGKSDCAVCSHESRRPEPDWRKEIDE